MSNEANSVNENVLPITKSTKKMTKEKWDEMAEAAEFDQSSRFHYLPPQLIKKLSFAKKQALVIDYLDGIKGPVYGAVKEEPFIELLAARRTVHEENIVFFVENKIAQFLSDELLGGKYLFNRLAHTPFAATSRKCIEHAEAWRYATDKTGEWPLPIVLKSNDKISFQRLDFDLDPNYDPQTSLLKSPNWDAILKRMSNSEAFCARIGSIFVSQRFNKKQYIWLNGDKDCGKSTIYLALEKLFGKNCCTTVTKKTLKSDFGMHLLIGKLVAFVHEAPADLIRTPEFKSLTGDKNHVINSKWANMFSAPLECLFFLDSNEAPEVQNDPATMRRIISCHLKKIEGDGLVEDEILKRLEDEKEAFVHKCVYYYQKLCNSDGSIRCDMEEVNTASNEYHFIEQATLAKYFENNAGAKIKASHAITLNRFTRLMAIEFRNDRNAIRNMKQYLKNKGHIYDEFVTIGDKRTRCLSSLTLKNKMKDFIYDYVDHEIDIPE